MSIINVHVHVCIFISNIIRLEEMEDQPTDILKQSLLPGVKCVQCSLYTCTCTCCTCTHTCTYVNTCT